MLDYEEETASQNHRSKKSRGQNQNQSQDQSQSQSENQSQFTSGSDASETSASGPKWTRKEKKRLAGILNQLDTLAALLMLAGAARNNHALVKDAQVISSRAEALAEKYVAVTREYPALARATDTFLKAGPLATLGGEMLGLTIAIMANHGYALPVLGRVVVNEQQ
jgi:hypothetical protein